MPAALVTLTAVLPDVQWRHQQRPSLGRMGDVSGAECARCVQAGEAGQGMRARLLRKRGGGPR